MTVASEIDSIYEKVRFASTSVLAEPNSERSHRRVVYLMRGLPACGKSTTARRLAGDKGRILETDAFFEHRTQEGEIKYRYREDLLEEARRWNFARFQEAVSEGCTPIVVDRGNGLNEESWQYADYAQAAGYDIQLKEPTSPWWPEIRSLLRYRPVTDPILDMWAIRLAELSEKTHHVPSEVIRDWMTHWMDDLTIDEILRY